MDAFFFITNISGMIFVVRLVTPIYYKSSISSPSSNPSHLLLRTMFSLMVIQGVITIPRESPTLPLTFWRLDQPHAPDSYSTGFVIDDISDGKFYL